MRNIGPGWIFLFGLTAVAGIDACMTKSSSSSDSGANRRDTGSATSSVDTSSCGEVCTKVDACSNLSPPTPGIPALSADGSGSADLDCAANCDAPDAAFYGYADCQIECLQGESCSSMQDCWDATSPIFAQYCDSDAPRVGSNNDRPDNGTQTGSRLADDAVSNLAVEQAVEDADFDVHTGSSPPDLEGLFAIQGEVYEASNARPVGSRISTELCFHNLMNSGADVHIDYCEYGVPGVVAAPITGEGRDFTVYFVYPEQATILLSGTVAPDGRSVMYGETLAVYTYTIGSWEKSATDWSLTEACDGSECTP